MKAVIFDEIIRGHFGDGREFGASVRYSKEKSALGAAAPLALLRTALEPSGKADLPDLAIAPVRGRGHVHPGDGYDIGKSVDYERGFAARDAQQ